MSKRLRNILFSSAFLVSFIALTFTTVSTADEFSDKEPIEKFVLKNGLTVILKNIPNAKLASCQYWVNTGSVYEEEYTATGISHFIEHMIFKGAEDIIPQKKISEKIEELGGKINAFTSHEVTSFYIKLPSSELFNGLTILADTIQSASFPEKEFEKEREVIMREMDMTLDNPQKRLMRLLWKTSFINHPYKYPVIGEKALFEKLTREDLLRYYYRKYMPNNSVLVVTGPFDTALTKKHIHETFGLLKASFKKDVALPEEPEQIAPRTYTETFDGTLAHTAIAVHSVSLNDPDLFALDVLALALASGEESILYKKLVREEQLAYDIDSWNVTPKDKGLFGIDFSCEPQNTEKIEEIIWQEIESVKKSGIAPYILEKAKNQTLANYIFGKESPSETASDLGYSEILTGTPHFSKYYTKGINAVSIDDIKLVAAKYLTQRRANKVTLTPKTFAEPSEKPAKENKTEPIPDTTKYVLKNGLTIILDEDRHLPIVSFACAFNGGLLLENEKNNGVVNLLSEMMLQGTKHLSSEDIFREVETAGGNISAYGGRNSSGILLKTLSKNTESSIILLSEILKNPAFPEKELAVTKNKISGYLKAQKENPFQNAFRIAKKALFKQHPYAFDALGTLKTIESITKQDIEKFYDKYITPQKTVITVSGDIDKDATIKNIEKYLEDWKEKPFEAPQIPPVIPIKKNIETVEKTDKKQSVIIQSFLACDIFSTDRYVLDIIASMLSSQSGRLFESIREEKGHAYAVGSAFIPGLHPGIFSFYCATTSQEIEPVKKIFVKEIDRLVNTTIPEAELIKYKKIFLSGEFEAMEKSQDKALRFALEELYGLGYDYYKKSEKIVNSITTEDIQKTAKKYFADNNSVITILKGRD